MSEPSTPVEQPVYTTDDRTPEDSPIEWLPDGPDLSKVTFDEYAQLLHEVELIEAEKNPRTGH